MGLNAFLKLPGIKGSARQAHVLGKIVVCGVTAQVSAGLDEKTGRPSKGSGTHVPMVITKAIDVSSPELHKALHKAEQFNIVTLEFWRMPPSGGNEENYFTIIMNGVQITGIKTVMLNNREPENSLIPELEEVSLSYDTVGYAFASGGKPDGTDAKTKSKSEVLDAAFDKPAEAKYTEIAIEFSKDASKFAAAELYALIKGEENK